MTVQGSLAGFDSCNGPEISRKGRVNGYTRPTHPGIHRIFLDFAHPASRLRWGCSMMFRFCGSNGAEFCHRSRMAGTHANQCPAYRLEGI